MEKEKILQILKEATFSVFETMFFLFPELVESEKDLPARPEGYFKALVRLNDNKWSLTLLGSEKLAGAMAKNFFGHEGPVDESQVADVFKEAANVIAGNFLTKLSNGDHISLSIPEVEKCSGFPAKETIKDLLELNINGEFFEVRIKGIDA